MQKILLQEGFRQAEIGGPGDFDVFAVSFHEADNCSCFFEYRGVVGEFRGIILLVGLSDEGKAEGLWGLDEDQPGAVDGVAGSTFGERFVTLAYRFADGDRRDGISVDQGGFQAPGEGFRGDQGPYAVVDEDDSIAFEIGRASCRERV